MKRSMSYTAYHYTIILSGVYPILVTARSSQFDCGQPPVMAGRSGRSKPRPYAPN